jgi:anaerobic selenocysteine-containing dehydrogenase
MKLSRRDFIKASAATGGIALAGCAAGKPVTNAMGAAKAQPSAPAKGEWVATTCQGCTAWCPVEIFVQEGRAAKVRGNQLSKANGGYCCPRGHLILHQLYDPDRLKTPMKRTNPQKGRGIDPKFVPISWDEALDLVADKMMELRNNQEPHKFGYLRGRYSATGNALLYGTLPKIFGSPHAYSHSAICAEAEKMGPGYTQGFFGYRDYDLANTRCLVIWGCDPLSSNRQVPNAIQKFGKVLDQGTVIAVDPRLSASASKAHEWLPLKAGSDGALACAIAHQLLVEGAWNKEFVGDFKDGVNRFKAGQSVNAADFAETETHGVVTWWNLALKDSTPAWAEQETLIPAEQIVRVARVMGKAAPATAVWMGPGATMHPRGTYSALAVYALNGLLGSIDAEGGVLQSNKAPVASFPKIDDFIDELAKKSGKEKKIDGRGGKDMPAIMGMKVGGGVVTNNVANGMLKNPGAIKVLLASWNNFNFSATGAHRWDEAMAKVPFFAHMVTNPSEMSQFADVILPSTYNAAEGFSIITNMANLHAHASIQQPVVKRFWDVKQEETEVVWLLAEKLKARGFSKLYEYYASFQDPQTGKTPTNVNEFIEIAARITSAPLWMPKEPLKGDKLAGWDDFRTKGIYNTEPYTFKKNWGKFKTETKKFEFYGVSLKKVLGEHAAKHKISIDEGMELSGYVARGELAFVPHYEPPKRHGSYSDYPFDFVDYKSRLNREGRSQNTSGYHEFKKVDSGDNSHEDVLKMNPADAKKLGLQTGDRVKVSSTTGSIVTSLKLWEGIRPGTVTKCYGQGHWAYGQVAAQDYAKAQPRGGNNNELLVDDYDRLSGSTARNGGFTGVRIEKI